jgi:isochorismate hydrolase
MEDGLVDVDTALAATRPRPRHHQHAVALLDHLERLGALVLEEVRREVLAHVAASANRVWIERGGRRVPFDIGVEQLEHRLNLAAAVGAVRRTNDPDELGLAHPLVRPAPAELVLYKRGVGALAGTELDRLLRLRDVNTLVLAGVATHFAVEGTAREAVDRGYRVVVLVLCCASRVSAVHRHSIEVILRSLGRVTTAERFIRELEDQGPSV